MGIVLLLVLLERGMFFEQFRCKTEILLSTYLCKIVTKVPYVLSHKFTFLDYSKEGIRGIPGTKIISNFLTKPGFHIVNINRYIFGHELGPAVCYHEFNAFEELISRSWHANCLLLDIDYSYTSCMSTLDHMMSIMSYPRKVGHDLDFKISL